MWFVYILLCNNGSYYIGSSNNVDQRVKDHLNGKGGRFTRSHKPQKLVYTEELLNKSEALKREAQLKKWSHAKKETIIAGNLKLLKNSRLACISDMKLALLLPGFLDSPDYLHMKTFEKRLKELGYTTERLDPCNLWKTGNIEKYSITNYLKQIKERVSFYYLQNPEEIVLIGHSMGGFVSIIAGGRIQEVTKIVALCSPQDRIKAADRWEGKKFLYSKRDLPEDPQKFRAFDVPYAFAEDGCQYSAAEEVKKIHKPLMIFIALEDTVVPPEQTEEIVANANNPYVVRQENMGHDFRHSRKECEIVMKQIEKFLLV